MASDDQDFGTAPTTVPSGTGTGSLLRDTRIKLGQEVSFVAKSLRIRQPYLEAIEDCRYHDLPGSTYAVGFVRGYAEYLGLDSAEIVRRFKLETGGDFGGRTSLVFPSAVSEGSIPTGALLFLAVVAASLAYGAWYWYQSSDISVADTVPALPDRLAALIHRPVGNGTEVVAVGPSDSTKPGDATAPVIQPPQASAGGAREDVVPPAEDETPQGAPAVVAPAPVAPAPVASAPVVSAPVVSAPVVMAPPMAPVVPAMVPSELTKPSDSKAAKEIKKAEAKVAAAKAAEAARVAETSPAVPADAAKLADADRPPEQPKPLELPKAEPSRPSEPAVAPASASSASSRVVLRADEDCWIEIRDASGVVVSRLLRKGESYPVPGRAGLTLTAGNAGALAVSVDGKPTSPLGRSGMVRRDVSLDADRLGGGE